MVLSLQTLCARELAKMSNEELRLVPPAARGILKRSYAFNTRSDHYLKLKRPPSIEAKNSQVNSPACSGFSPVKLNSEDRFCIHADKWLSKIFLACWCFPPGASEADGGFGPRRVAPVHEMVQSCKLRCVLRGNNRETSWGYLQ